MLICEKMKCHSDPRFKALEQLQGSCKITFCKQFSETQFWFDKFSPTVNIYRDIWGGGLI